MIRENSLSYSSIRQQLEEYVQSLDGYETTWKDFYEGGAGQTVLDVGSGIAAFLAYTAYMNRRDTMLDFGQLPSTIVSIGTALGYHYNRKMAPILQITFNSASSVFWDREDPIGSYKGQDICLLESTQINSGSNTIRVAVGSWKSYETTINETKDFFNLMVEDDIDNNYYSLLVNGEVTETTLAPENLTSSSVLLRSYLTGVFLIFGNGILGRKATVGDTIRFEYIVPSANLAETIIEASDISLFPEATEITTITLDPGSTPDTTEKIVAVAPGYFSARRQLTSLSDYKAIAGSYNGISAANARKRKVDCCAVEVTYVRYDRSLMTEAMKTDFYNYMMKHAILGTEIYIIDPVFTFVDVSLTMVITRTADTQAIRNVVNETLQSMCLKPGALFSISSLASAAIPGLIRMYFNYPIVDKQAEFNRYFVLRDVNINFTTDNTAVLSGGSDVTLGYEDYVGTD
jgi:hypothetical protein